MSKLFFDRLFIGDISKWDVSNVEIMDEMFADSDFKGNISNWDVSHVTEMNGMFQGSKFNGDISKWNVSNVISMEKMFKNSQFDGDISNWNISNVEITTYMFSGSKFNGDISKWNTHKIVNMQGMFQSSVFNGDISNWDLSNCLDTAYMFETSEFNGDISKWDMSGVEAVSHMFFRSKFNQDISSWVMKPLYDAAIFNECPIKNEFKPKKYQKTNESLDFNNIDVKTNNVRDMYFEHMFENLIDAKDFNKLTYTEQKLFLSNRNGVDYKYKYKVKSKEELKNIINTVKVHPDKKFVKYADFTELLDFNWLDVSDITDMEWMFYNENSMDENFNDYLVSTWDVSNVTTMNGMFMQCYNFNQDISNWNVKNVKDFNSMFFCCHAFNQDISKWDTSSAIDMCSMFGEATVFNQDISNWDVSNVEYMSFMFAQCKNFNQDLSKWNIRKVSDMTDMFQHCKNLEHKQRWNLDGVKTMFMYQGTKCEHLGVNENVDFDKLQNKSCGFDVIISALDLVDLGLPSGTLWCKHNLGATDETEYGDYFAWGINTHNNYFSWTSYDYAEYSFLETPLEYVDAIKLTKYCISKNDGTSICDNVDNKTLLDLEDDAAYTKNKNYCIPTSEQYQELLNNTTHQIVSNYKQQGVTGILLKSIHNGQTIFFPFAGYMNENDVKRFDKWGCYWTNNLNQIQTHANIFCATTNMESKITRFRRDKGISIRPVLK